MNSVSVVKPTAVVYVLSAFWVTVVLFLAEEGSSTKGVVYKIAAGLIGVSALTIVATIFFFKKWYTATNVVLTSGIPAYGVAWSAKLNAFGWQPVVVIGFISGVLLVLAIMFNLQNFADE